MFGSAILEVAIGLIFIYILLSLFCTTVTELIARFTSLRSSTLEQGIRNLLTDPEKGTEIADSFFQHPLITKLGLKDKGMAPEGKKGNPSYISSSYFALALYDTLFPEDPEKGSKSINQVRKKIGELPDDLQKPLLALLANTGNDLTVFRKNIEGWFDELMDRVNGWYSRKAQVITLIIAIVVTVIFNADSLMMANTLTRNSTLRDAIVAAAGQIDANEAAPAKNLGELQSELLGTGVIGWLNVSDEYVDSREYPTTIGGVLLKIAGLLLTAALVSLGAPFWFDILSKVSNIRATGLPPAVPQTSGSENSSGAGSGNGGNNDGDD